jgi:steroid delta-isomerase
MRTVLRSVAAALALACAAVPAVAADDPAAAIRAVLERWRDDFNTGRAAHICDLFAPDLLYDFQGLPEQDYAQICARLHRALAVQPLPFHYGLRIKEVMVSGDLAVVRLTWTATLTLKDGQKVTDEPGLDVFRREAGGAWRIARFMAYTAAP